MNRRNTKRVTVGVVPVGGGSDITVQSMTNTDTKNVPATVGQILALEDAGCDIVRCAVYDLECAGCLPAIKEKIHIPLVADVHFDADIAVAAIEAGADKIRINPGNIGKAADVRRVAQAAKAHGIPIRVGANAGSLSKSILQRFGGPTADALCESAMENIRIVESAGFSDIVVSIKSSSAPVCVHAYRKVSGQVNYPLHLGVTEAGTFQTALVKSSIGIGGLLVDGIGDTLRVSVTGDPVQEVYAARDILKACGFKVSRGCVEIVSCPTCARCSLDIEKIAIAVEQFTRNMKVPMKIAVMGCAVNGPGEAREADIGVAGGRGEALLFAKGKPIRKLDAFDILPELKRRITAFQKENETK